MHFRDDTSAFDGKKKEALARKGMVNNVFNAFIMARLEEAGILTHFEKRLSETESLVKRMEMIPVECVIRNVAAGSLVKRLGVEEGVSLSPPTFELFLKNDAQGALMPLGAASIRIKASSAFSAPYVRAAVKFVANRPDRFRVIVWMLCRAILMAAVPLLARLPGKRSGLMKAKH